MLPHSHTSCAQLRQAAPAIAELNAPYKLLMSTKPDLRRFPHQHHHRRMLSTRARRPRQKSNTKWQQLVANTQHLTLKGLLKTPEHWVPDTSILGSAEELTCTQ